MNEHISKRQHLHGDTITNLEGLETYVVKHIIGKGSHSVVHLATCTRGRLRGRNVALKFIPRPPFLTPALESLHIRTTLHKSLHHPAVISLHSAFTIKEYYCIILELCEGGSLHDFLQARTECEHQHAECDNSESLLLNEAQLRPILRSVVEALSYLHARGIFHQSLSTHNIFLTADGRIKLGGIGHSLPDCPLRVKYEQDTDRNPKNNYLKSAEHPQCGVQADLTSLVHLVMTLFGGIPLSKGGGEAMRIVHTSHVSTTPPTNIKCTDEAQGLLANLLKQDTLEAHLCLNNIISLPFFHPTQQTQFLDLKKFNPAKLPRTSKGSKVKKGRALPSSSSIDVYVDAQPMGKTLTSAKPLDGQEDGLGCREESKQSKLQYRMPPGVKTARLKSELLSETYTLPGSRLSSGSSTAASSGIRDAWTKLATRQKPIPRDYDIPRVTAGPVEIHTRVTSLPLSGEKKRMALGDIVNLGDSSRLGMKYSEKHYSDALSPRKPVAAPASQPPSLPASPRPVGLTPARDETPVPRTNLSAAFKVPPLFPQTHKLAQGQIVVMPSCGLLVDLREGERRGGSRGDRVMCISADGQEISVFDAPHLSTPCILSEPLATWKHSSLPPSYWTTYNFAAKFIESVKKRRPRMVWYTTQAKFTLMSNGPQGDLHATFPCPPPETQKRRRDRGAKTFTRMRIVLSRVRGSVEVSRFTDNKWLTKVGTHPMESGGMDLIGEEKAALECVLAALEVCEAAEAQCSSESEMSGKISLSQCGKAQSKVQDSEAGKTGVSHSKTNNSKAVPANYLDSGSGLSYLLDRAL